MTISNLADFSDEHRFEADLVIIGGGPAGLTIAQQFAQSSIRVLLLESGLMEENKDHSDLLAVESVGEPFTLTQKQKRTEFHGESSNTWSQEAQPFGVRCRALGGSTHAWAGKSAPFDAIDFRARPWIDNSGWPITRAEVQPFIERAYDVLNLSPALPETKFTSEDLASFYWQFARSRLDKLDIMRFGREFASIPSDTIQVLLNATVTNIGLNEYGESVSHLTVSDLAGRSFRIKAPLVVLAASGIENPRLLLASNDIRAEGIGNGQGAVGRYLMDHPGARVAQVGKAFMNPFLKRFGFQGIRHNGRAHMFMHGLALSPEVQDREGLLNAAVYFATQRAPDDPWDALKRLIRRKSAAPVKDLVSMVAGAGLLAKGGGTKMLSSHLMPSRLKDVIINGAIRLNPNLVAEEFQNQGVPHKILGLSLDAISEQLPNRDSRVTLSDRTDKLGVPMAKVDWRINDIERRTLIRIAHIAEQTFAKAGLAGLTLEDWVTDERLDGAVIIDMAHTLGTTRMSKTHATGVVDANCQVHGVNGLYVAGGSVFPTSGHANPTLMILSLAVRLADHLKTQLKKGS